MTKLLVVVERMDLPKYIELHPWTIHGETVEYQIISEMKIGKGGGRSNVLTVFSGKKPQIWMPFLDGSFGN